MQASFDYTGANVLIFGGTSGINLGIAEAFAKAGATVGVCSRSEDKVNAAVETLKAYGGKAAGYSLDVRNVDDVKSAAQSFHDEFGKIDVLVSGAAGNFPAPALGMSPNAFNSVVSIDLLGTFHVLQSCHPYLKQPGASVINISAPQAYVPMMFQSHVCAAKAGVDMLTRTLALEWGPMGIRVNSIVPGPIANTEGMDRLAPSEESKNLVRKSVPLGRFGEKSEIADTAMFLSSNAAQYVSGVILAVDGGWGLSGAGSLANSMMHG
ncbi:short-chain dehydrogenase [Kordiimonas sediminis]|uniref:Short-chain dehydrogenase n=1 Tax=Kordiimonas sediminis TaxID=1735581 RepID=A0A919ASW4_9PROT|nr:SDR family oxidoreductase [Kordiimonas sediminis]GHF25352.1 short-chain dehydrogenase [Kordiimonas sediminis]